MSSRVIYLDQGKAQPCAGTSLLSPFEPLHSQVEGVPPVRIGYLNLFDFPVIIAKLAPHPVF